MRSWLFRDSLRRDFGPQDGLRFPFRFPKFPKGAPLNTSPPNPNPVVRSFASTKVMFTAHIQALERVMSFLRIDQAQARERARRGVKREPRVRSNVHGSKESRLTWGCYGHLHEFILSAHAGSSSGGNHDHTPHRQFCTQWD